MVDRSFDEFFYHPHLQIAGRKQPREQLMLILDVYHTRKANQDLD